MSESTSSQALNALGPEAQAAAKSLAPKDAGEAPGTKSLSGNPEFAAYLNKLADYATAQSNSPQAWERRRKAVRLRKYVLGEYYGIFDKQRGWVSGKSEGDGIYYDPQTATFIEILVASLVKTKPQKICTARSAERADKREAAKVAQKLLELDDEQDFTPKRQQREWKWNLLTAGETYRITHFNPSKPGKGVDEDVFEPMEVDGGDTAHFCPLCSSIAVDEKGNCAECGNPQVDEFRAVSTTVTVRKGTRFKQVGDVDYDIPDALEMTVIGETDTIAEALMVLRDRMIPRCVLEDALGIDNLPKTGTPDTLNYKQLFETKDFSGGSIPEFEPLHYQELWISPAVYTSYTFPADAITSGGGRIPAGTRLKDIFPDGLYVSRIKKKICELYPQPIGECLSHAVNSIGEGFHGRGEWDLIELQDQLTEAKSMKMNSMLLDSTQPLFIRNGVVDGNSFENKFGLVVPVSEDSKDIRHDDIAWRLPASAPPAEAYQIGEEIKGQMQSRVGAFSTQTDSPDIKAMGTATGIAALTEHSLGRRAPALQLYAQMEIDHAYQKLEQRQKYWCRKMYEPVAKEIGGDAVKWFIECNVRQDIAIGVVPDSWVPKLEMQKQANFEAFLRVSGQFLAAKGDPKLLDEVVRKANEIYGAGVDFNDFETESVEAQLRLDKLRDVAAFVEQQFGEFAYDGTGANQEALRVAYQQAAQLLKIAHIPADEADIFSDLPLDTMFDDHSEFTEAYSAWLKTSEGRSASAFVRTAVRQLADYHIQAETYRQMKLKEYANAAQLPDLQAQLVANDATHAQQLDHNDDDERQAMAHAAAEQVGQAMLDGAMPPQHPPPPDARGGAS